ncbi:mRNA-decapping enzyme subunit 1 [Lobulomyces angularis]|nr:mRNA-decapping enzyme subunit 1 [Lobulomyces angularis]
MNEQKYHVNLNVLKRTDKKIVSIMDMSSHTVLYDFNVKNNQWTKKGIEGTLFIYKRSEYPEHAFCVMNRLGVENLTVNLVNSVEINTIGDYVIYKTEDEKIHGLWMYEVKDRARLANLMSSLCQNSVPPPTTNKVDILGLLQKATIESQQQQFFNQHQKQQEALQQQQINLNKINSLMDIYNKLELLTNHDKKLLGKLNFGDFFDRLNFLLKDQKFLEALYGDYLSRE